jgi:hypothetical protein
VKNSFFLVLPSQQKSSERLKRYEEETLNRWIVNLPTANYGLTTRLFHDFIREFNQTEMNIQLRLDTLDTLKPIFTEIEDYLRIRLTKTGFPKGENAQKILEVIVSIEKEFTIAYWRVVKDLTQRRISWLQGKNTALAIQRTMQGLGNIVVTYYMVCLPVPDWVWIDLHSLYKLSIKVKKDTIKIPDNLDKPSDVRTITDCYMQILLLSLTEPGGLMQKEVQQVYRFISQFSHLVFLQKKPIGIQMLQCVVLIDEDAPPEFERSEQPPNTGKWYINFSHLYKVMEKRDKMVAKNSDRFNPRHRRSDKTEKLPAELVDYLEQRWIGTELHGMPCVEDRLDRIFSIGLESTYDLQHSIIQEQHTEREYLAQSASDKALSCHFNKEGLLSTGSLISFRDIDSLQNQRNLGLVNKIVMSKHSNYTLEFEIKLITASINAIDYQLKNEVDENILQKALFYKETDHNIEKRFIIVDSYLLKEEDIIQLILSPDKFWIKLFNKKNVGLGYWQFECQRIVESTSDSDFKKKIGYDFI